MLLPTCPVAWKRPSSGHKQVRADASGAVVEGGETDISGTTASTKVAKGPNTGVEFRFYKHKEYKQLSSEEKAELAEW